MYSLNIKATLGERSTTEYLDAMDLGLPDTQRNHDLAVTMSNNKVPQIRSGGNALSGVQNRNQSTTTKDALTRQIKPLGGLGGGLVL